PAAPVAPPATSIPTDHPVPGEDVAPARVAKSEQVGPSRASLEESTDFESGLLAELLTAVLETGASDLHITAGARPMLRLHGSLMAMEDKPELTPPALQRMIYAILTQRQREKFEEVLEL